MNKALPTVFIVDDDVSFLKGIERLLRYSGYVTECFSSARDFLEQRSPSANGCVLCDLQMPGMDGLALQEALAHSDNPLPVVFLTGQGDIPISVKAMHQGAEDFLVKTTPKETIFAAIQRALERNIVDYRRRSHRQAVQSLLDKLTLREHQVLLMVLKGLMNKQIAFNLAIHERSVKRHRTNLMRKLGVKSIAELFQLCLDAGIIKPSN